MKNISFSSTIILWALFFVLISVQDVRAQADFSGLWKGIITQNEGGAKSQYEFELYLYQSGTQVFGRSYVFYGDHYAEMEIKGDIYNNNYLRFQESQIVNHKITEDMEWCLKRGHLILQIKKNQTYVTGIWKGSTSFSECIPGRIELRREVMRAEVKY